MDEVDNILIPKQWGYQTICFDEEAVTGLYEIKNYYQGKTIYGWKRPSIKSDKHEISHIIYGYSVWGLGDKYNKKDQFNWVKVSEKPIYWIPKEINM